MKKRIGMIWIWAGLILLPHGGVCEVVDRIVALVNDDVIFLSEIEEAGRFFFEQIRKSTLPQEREEKLKRARQEVLERLIEEKLLEQEMRNRKIEVSERDVDMAIEEVMKKNHLSENELKKALAKEGLTYSAYRQRVRLDLGKMRLISREIKSKIVVKEEEIRKYYRENPEEFTDPLEVKLQQIFIPLPDGASAQEVEATREKAQAIWRQARAGADFGELVRKHSRGPEAQEGGVLGYFKKGELRAELEMATFALSPGQISELVETPQGFHILRLLERRGGEPRPFAEVQFRIREKITQTQGLKQFEEWLKTLKSKAYIEIRLS